MKGLMLCVGVAVVAYVAGQHVPSVWVDAALTWGAGVLNVSADPFLLG